MNVIDKMLLPKETKNLVRINELAHKFNSHLDGTYLQQLKREFQKIKTKEHKSIIDFYLSFIDVCQK